MTNLKDFFNYILYDNKIFTREDIKQMSTKEFSDNELAIKFQLSTMGIPSNIQLADNKNVVYVHSYKKANGNIVKAHYRTKPDNATENNFSYSTNETTTFLKLETENKLASINAKMNKDRPNAKELLNLSLVKGGLKNAPKTNYYKILSNDFTNDINNLFKLNKTNLEINKNWYGIRYSKNSSFSKNLSNSEQLQRQVKEYCKNNKNISSDEKIPIELTEDKNLHYSIGHGTILNPQVDSTGYFKGLLFDKYDYDLILKNIFDETNKLNNSAYILQSLNIIKNYYILIPINFKLK